MLPNPEAFLESDGLLLDHSAPASGPLLTDLRSDAGMEWVPDDAWLTKVVIDAPADALDFDLAIDASGAGNPSPVDAGYAPFSDNPAPRSPMPLYLLLVAVATVVVPVALARVARRGPFSGPPPAAA